MLEYYSRLSIMKILLVDDEVQLTDALSAILKRNKFTVDVANDGESGYDLALYGNYDLIVLDIMLPKMDGFEVLSKLRKENISIPILLLSAKSETYDKVTGLNKGADDYLTKPFEADELIARINALLRRRETYVTDNLSLGNTSLNSGSHTLESNGKSIQLGAKEYQVMEILMRNPTMIISKETINDKVWGFDSDAEYNNIEVYISFIRRKLTALNSDISIKAYRGTGYRVEKL